MSKCQFNDDIWYNVVRFLSPEDLRQVNSCHHVLFEGWMRYRYTSVKLVHRDQSIRLLERLCDTDSTAAAYIRKVEIRPWLVQSLPHSIDSSAKFPNLLQSSRTSKAAKERLQKRANEDASWVKAAFGRMPHVTEYSIDWDGSFQYHPELYQACLTSGLDAWSDNLIKLTVKVPPAMLNSFAEFDLPKLDSFNWHLYTGFLSLKEINMATDGFMVFLNNLKDSLRALCILSTHSSRDLDLSRIFRKMGRFPLLSQITLSIPADGHHLSDPVTFVRFLEKHRSSLEVIGLQAGPAPSCDKFDKSGDVVHGNRNHSLTVASAQPTRSPLRVFSRFMDQLCSKFKEMSFLSTRASPVSKAGGDEATSWIPKLAECINTPFPRLRTLSVSLAPSGACLYPLLKLINAHSSTLDSLSLGDCTLLHDEVLSILQPSAIRPEPLLRISTLSLRIPRFSSELLIDLAFLLPDLKTAQMECISVLDIDESALKQDILRLGWGLQLLEISTIDQHLGDAQTTTIIDFSKKIPEPDLLSFSSYVTALDSGGVPSGSLSSFGRFSVVSDTSVCSVASSSTNDTDYGQFYTRRALSQVSNDWGDSETDVNNGNE